MREFELSPQVILLLHMQAGYVHLLCNNAYVKEKMVLDHQKRNNWESNYDADL